MKIKSLLITALIASACTNFIYAADGHKTDHATMMNHNPTSMMDHNVPAMSAPKPDAKTLKLDLLSIKDNGAKKIVQIKLSTIVGNKSVNLDDLKEVHTKKFHLLVIDDSLEDYSHIHPTKTNVSGVYEFEWSPKKSGNYKMWADLFPLKTNSQEYVMSNLVSNKTEKSKINRKTIMENTVGGYTFKLSFNSNRLKVGQATMGTIVVTDAQGKPVKNLEPIMGAFAHIVGFYDDINTVVHVHPMGKEPSKITDRGGPDLQFHIEPQKAGFVKLFAQVKINNTELFVPFAFDVN